MTGLKQLMIRNKVTSNNGVEQTKRSQGFTLLELLIVIAIIAILSVILVLVINPAETLKKSRDAQRISDLSTLKTALGLVVTASSTPYLSQVSTDCLVDSGALAKIFYSSEVADASCAVDVVEGTDAAGTFDSTDSCKTIGTTGASSVSGTGWIPVKFSWLTGGSPISNLPLDPTNTAISTTPTSTDMVYRYACQKTSTTKPNYVFEIDAQLESNAYTVDDNKKAKDGGDNDNYYETGTNLKLIGTGTNF